MHALDFFVLIILEIIDEFEQRRVVGRSRLFHQILDHIQRALMMRDHER